VSSMILASTKRRWSVGAEIKEIASGDRHHGAIGNSWIETMRLIKAWGRAEQCECTGTGTRTSEVEWWDWSKGREHKAVTSR
jgi:hypothetical protein